MGDSVWTDRAPNRSHPPDVPIMTAAQPSPLIQVTTAADGPFHPRFYSYWSNAWVQGTHAIVFAGHIDGLARFFDVDLVTGVVVPLGSLIKLQSTTEGWSWNHSGRITLCDGPRLLRINPFIVADPGEVLADISETHPGCRIVQSHSSDDGQVHSATVERITSDGPYQRIGTLAVIRGQQQFFPAEGALDESQVTSDGAYLIIKENDDNRIVTMATGEERRIADHCHAIGHSDCGPGYVVGEADKPDPGMCGWWDLTKALTPEQFHPLFQTLNMGYVSVRGNQILHSSDTQLRMIDRETGAITPLLDHGVTSGNYDDRVKASLSPCGRVATYMANRIVYLLVLVQ